MANRTVQAAAEGMPKSPRRKPSTKVKAPSIDPLTLEIMEKYSRMTPADQRAFRAACLAVRDGVDPTDEIIAAVGKDYAQPFLDIWQVFVRDAADKAEAAR